MVHTSSKTLDVLIVGAGPVGLFLANECARRGLRCRIIEAHSGQSLHSKALAIFPRTLEIFDMAGLAPEFLSVANRVQSVAVMSHDRELAEIQFEPDGTPYSFIAMVPQNITERVLVTALQRKRTEVEYDTQFLALEQLTNGVSVTVEQNGKREEIHSAFVVGCDGAHSAIRKAMGIALHGGEYDMPFMLADIETNQELSSHQLQLCSSSQGPIAIFPISKAIRASALYLSSYFRIHHRHAETLRTGRVFLAGDAAHIHSPFGGQGMNTGLHDIWNLVWKIELVVRGFGTDSLLDSYSEERLPIIQEVIETTDRLTKALGTPNALAQFFRDSLIPLVLHIPAVRHSMVDRLSGLGISYSGSLIRSCGKRALDDCMRGGQLTYAQFLLFIPEDVHPSFRESARSLASEFHGLLTVRESHVEGIRLVRPDGYVSFCSEDDNEGYASHALRALLAKMLGTPVLSELAR